jgi:hypothetical protein
LRADGLLAAARKHLEVQADALSFTGAERDTFMHATRARRLLLAASPAAADVPA